MEDRRGVEEERGGRPEMSRSEEDRRGVERKENMRRLLELCLIFDSCT